MNLQRQLKFWAAALVILVALLWLLGGIMLPFEGGLVLAYLLRPLVDRLERAGINRMVVSIGVVTLVFLFFVLVILLVAPLIASQVSAFIAKIPEYVSKLQNLLNDPQNPWLQKLAGVSESLRTDDGIADLVKQGTGWLTAFLAGLWSGGQSLISLFSLIVVMPVVTFYLVYDWHRMIRTVDNWVPVQHRSTVRQLAREIDAANSGFIRGQTAVCVLLGIFYAVGLALTGLNFGVLIGLTAGLITFIPYVGSLTGLVLSAGVAVAQFWPDWSMVAVVIGIFAVGQFIEGNILSPKLVGDSVGLHPVWLIFALLAFGSLLGFAGLLLAVPLAATLGVLVRFAFARYRESEIYTGGRKPSRRAPPRRAP